MKTTYIFISILLLGVLNSCSHDKKADGYGNFEAREITVSSEANGKLVFLKVEEGEALKKGEIIGLVDTLQLYLNKKQLLASKAAIASKSGGVWSQVGVLKQQLKTAKTEQNRIQNMFNAKAASQRQLDQINSQVGVLKKQIQNVETQNAPILNEVKSIESKIAQINLKIANSKITSPINGIVLNKFAEAGELTTFGKPIFKIADLKEMTLRVYISETQLSTIKIGEEVKVKIDSAEKTKTLKGVIRWISAAAEFTPKIIQTKEERVNLVYAVKVSVKNNGELKIGMPAEMWIEKK